MEEKNNELNEETKNLPIEKKKEIKFCVECLKKGIQKDSMYLCKNCNDYYCVEHEKQYHQNEDHQNHLRIKINSIYDFSLASTFDELFSEQIKMDEFGLICSKHKIQKEFFCFQDKTPLCYKCAIQNHNGHDIKPFDEFEEQSWTKLIEFDPKIKELTNYNQTQREEFKNKYKDQIKQSLENRKQKLIKIDNLKENIQNTKIKLTNEIENNYKKLKKELKLKNEKIKNQLNQEYSQTEKKLNHEFQVESQNINLLKKFEKYFDLLDQAIKNKNNLQIFIQKLIVNKYMFLLNNPINEINCQIVKINNRYEKKKEQTEKKYLIKKQIEKINTLRFLEIENEISIEQSKYQFEKKQFHNNEIIKLLLILKNCLNNTILNIDDLDIKLSFIDSTNDQNIIKIEQLDFQSNNDQIGSFQTEFKIQLIGTYIVNFQINQIEFPKKTIQIISEKSPSNILSLELFKQLQKHLPMNFKLHLNYYLNRNTRNIQTWHKKCDNKGKSLIICKNHLDYIFGAYSDIGFGKGNCYKESSESFLFYYGSENWLKILCLTGKDNNKEKLIKFNQRTNNKINWNSKDIIELKKEIYKYTYNELLKSKSWKVQRYFTILRNQNSLFTTQKYLRYPSSSTILKFRTFTNCLSRYYYVINKNSNKFCPLCLKYKQKEVIENIDHFLWVCPSYENNRLIFLNKLNEKNLYELILNHNSLLLFSLVNNRGIYDFKLKFLKGNLSIRATRV
ncbi:e3 ubiquitin-protein ligase trim56 [Anaeramoeba flamelloides]|uniref:E3 ubiquitin-protein ligase trim56 n=1 Tax=Anaeramoeba flamelloides TaxID=1746091 RepID=A0AAV8A9S4_9EUKA|nr:e3 ubiquitin-protein ligase trim56 [Anaeramoeba flamelloides]